MKNKVNRQSRGKTDWLRLQTVLEISQILGIGFSLTYEESCDTWYFTTNSGNINETFIGKSYTFDGAVDSVLDHLNKFKKTA